MSVVLCVHQRAKLLPVGLIAWSVARDNALSQAKKGQAADLRGAVRQKQAAGADLACRPLRRAVCPEQVLPGVKGGKHSEYYGRATVGSALIHTNAAAAGWEHGSTGLHQPWAVALAPPFCQLPDLVESSQPGLSQQQQHGSVAA